VPGRKKKPAEAPGAPSVMMSQKFQERLRLALEGLGVDMREVIVLVKVDSKGRFFNVMLSGPDLDAVIEALESGRD
jgi:hypothetical protein